MIFRFLRWDMLVLWRVPQYDLTWETCLLMPRLNSILNSITKRRKNPAMLKHKALARTAREQRVFEENSRKIGPSHESSDHRMDSARLWPECWALSKSLDSLDANGLDSVSWSLVWWI